MSLTNIFKVLSFMGGIVLFAMPVFAGKSSVAMSEHEKAAASSSPSKTEAKAQAWSVNKPSGSWKSIRINTDEVTWSSVDVSPDGQTLVFDALGDIYTVSIQGGTAKALTSDIAWNIQPKFSPDGQKIVFISDRSGADNIWLMQADGSSPRELTKERNHLLHNPTWSPDGQWIVARKGYVSRRSIPAGELWRYHVSGGTGTPVVKRRDGDKDQKNIAEPAYSSDGRYLYFSQDTTKGWKFEYNRDATGQIYVVQRYDWEKKRTETLVSGAGGAVRPTPSHDGKQLAFVKRLPNMKSALFVKDLASGNERMLYDQLDRDEQEIFGVHGLSPAFAWTPDSKTLVFWAGGKFHSIDTQNSTVKTIPVEFTIDKQIRETVRFSVDVAPERFPVKMVRWAQYSPNGRQVLFQALGYLHLKDLKTGKVKRVTKQQEHFEFWPRFSPDGKWIVYTTWDDEQLGSVRVVSSKGGKGRKLTLDPGHYAEVRFAPNSKDIVYRKLSGGYILSPTWSLNTGIYLTAINKAKKPALRVSAEGFNPQFSADGQRILFSTPNSGSGLILKSTNLQGLETREHAKSKKSTEFSVSPDNQWLAFVEQFKVHVLPFTLQGGAVDVSANMKTIPSQKISIRAGEFVHWSADSQFIHWVNGSHLSQLELQQAFSFLQENQAKPGKKKDIDIKQAINTVDLSYSALSDKPNSLIALVGADVVTMRDAENQQEVLRDAVILVEHNRIKTIGVRGSVDIPAQAYQLDVTGKTIIPGLIDGHAHGGVARNEITPEQNWMQFANVAFGVTTVHDPSNDTSEIFAFSELQKAGLTLGPRVFSTGAILYGALYPGLTSEVKNLDDARFHVERLKNSGAISVKSYNQLRRDSRQQVIAAAEKQGIMVVPEGGGKFQHNLTHIIDGHTSVEHALPLANIYQDVVQLWAATDTVYSPTFVVCYGGIWGENYWYDKTDVFNNEHLLRYVPKSRLLPRSMRRIKAPHSHYNHVSVAREAKKLRDAGVPVVIGAHGQLAGLAAHWEMWMMQQGGFSAWEALRGATIDSATFLGMKQDIGSLEIGKLADLVIIEGDVLNDLRQSEQVAYTMINGRLYDVKTMQELGSGDFQREPFFFEREGGDSFPAESLMEYKLKAERYHWEH